MIEQNLVVCVASAEETLHLFIGAKIHKTAGLIRVIEKSGKTDTVKENEIELERDIQIYVDHANEVSTVVFNQA